MLCRLSPFLTFRRCHPCHACSLLGFPIQFIGLIATPYLALRYYVDKEAEPLQDVEVRVCVSVFVRVCV